MNIVFVHPERCIGCRQCEFACAVAHSKSQVALTALTEEPPPRSRIHVAAGATSLTSFPVKCRHCEPAPCLSACPTGAIYRDADLDLVLIDQRKCISCAMCAMVCPFDALSFHALSNGAEPHTVAVKCDGCADRLRQGREPACVEACKVNALEFGDLNEIAASGRASEAEAVLTATAAVEPVSERVPGNVIAWRTLNRSAAETREV